MEKEFTRFNSWKVLRFPDKLEQITNYNMSKDIFDIPTPLVWHVYPSNICNMNCGFCIMSQEKKQYPKKLTKTILFKLVDDANRLGVKMIHFSGGGEPFLNPYLLAALKYNKQNFNKPTKITVSTNGVFLDPGAIEYINHLRVSINASCPETHIKLMGAKSNWFERVLSNIRWTIFKAKQLPGTHDIGLAFLITPDNWVEVYKFCEIAAELGVDFVHIRPAYYSWNDKRNIELMDIMRNKMKPILEIIEKDFGSKMVIGATTEKFEGYWTKRNYDKCRSTPLSACLTASGEFIVCQDIFIRFGDYYKQSFEEIWFSEEHKKAMDMIDLPHCPRCVETRHNQIIEHFFIRDNVRSEII